MNASGLPAQDGKARIVRGPGAVPRVAKRRGVGAAGGRGVRPCRERAKAGCRAVRTSGLR
ncbi:MAG: hypothetical protein F9K15_19165 [Zoogloea sp.]|nr:MAG: hypothetical protein F9K15_19165 [Zoogloea sp.]